VKLFLAALLFVSYLFFVPDYFSELAAQVFNFEEMITRILRVVAMLGGAIAFVAFTPIEWFKSASRFK